jgi:hypothetical protein
MGAVARDKVPPIHRLIATQLVRELLKEHRRRGDALGAEVAKGDIDPVGDPVGCGHGV